MLAYLKKHGDLFITLSAIAGGLAILITINGNRFEAQEKLMNQRFEQVNQRFDRLTDEVSELRRIMVGT